MDRDQLIREFHEMWDAFPGMARLITSGHEILAVNDVALGRGFEPGLTCAKVGSPEMHRGCLLAKALKSGEGCFDMPNEHLVRGWAPVGGCDDVVVHFSLSL
ncbi:MAG: hypothetical protein IJI88_06930 [Atopobiaceae bacterium]|nr:hypothetical protein [Olsenella sp.]MBQ6491993.1 hypothetical protein [Atopobiaceae bacterium]